MSGRGPIYLTDSVPTRGMALQHAGYTYIVEDVFPRRGNLYRCRVRSNDAKRLEMWFTLEVTK